MSDMPREDKVFGSGHFLDRHRAGRPIIRSIDDVSQEFLSELKAWIEGEAGLSLPATSILGYSRDQPRQAFVATSESTSSTSYTNLATVGPEITDLSAGRYLCIYGAVYDSASGSDGFMSPSINGGAPTDNDAAYAKAALADRYNIVRASIQALSLSTTNTIRMQYRVSGTTNSFENRWLVIARISNA